jgi:hypothetical protein
VKTILHLGPFVLLGAVGLIPAVRTAGAPLLSGLVGVAWLGLLRRFVLAHSSPAPDPARSRRLAVSLTLGAQWFLAILTGLSAIPRQGPGLVAMAAGIGILFLPAALIATYARKAPETVEIPAPPPRGWLLVPRANGTGLRIAPHHPLTWAAVALFAAGPIALILVAILA